MLRIIDMLQASANRKAAITPHPSAADVTEEGSVRSDNVQAEAERSRSPTAMTRKGVRGDLARMMRSFSVEPSNVSLYEDELVEAEYACALCQHVGRCRAWMAQGCQGDAPRLFCANAALLEEITPDPFWSSTAPGTWHADTQMSPVLGLLASDGASQTDTLPRLGARRLERFVNVASTIDNLIDRWSSKSVAPDESVETSCVNEDLEAAIDDLFDRQKGLGKADFARILQVALCDSRLASCLCRLQPRSRQVAEVAKQVVT